MKKITPIETFRNAVVRHRAPLPGSKKLPTSFRKQHSFSLEATLSESLTRMHKEFGINVSQGVEPLIKRWAAKTARELNESRR